MSARRLHARRDRSAGFSVAEVTTMLAALTILAGVSAPAIHNYIDDARLVRATHDAGTIAVSLVRMFNDVGAERRMARGWAAYDLLVGAGDVPATASRDSAPWGAAEGTSRVGAIDDQLINNGAAYSGYRMPALPGWRGPYLQKAVGADPWGRRYAVNVRALRSETSDTFVLSAGPDGLVTMPFEADGLTGTTDDIAALVASSGIGP